MHLGSGGLQVVESDLFAMGWDPVVHGEGLVEDGRRFDPTGDPRRVYVEGSLPDDVRREQEKLASADAVVVQFPLWW